MPHKEAGQEQSAGSACECSNNVTTQNENLLCKMLTRNNLVNPSRQITLEDIENSSELDKVKLKSLFQGEQRITGIHKKRT